MTHRWISELKNVVNCPLQSAWIQMAETFNQHIAGEVDDRWSVLHPPTGTGKTEGLKLYCTMLPEENNPGVLIVTRLKDEAKEIANSINDIAQKQIAEYHYRTHKLSEHIMQKTPVLIITHRAYELSLEKISDNSDTVKWSQFCEWKNGARRLVVIDEALNV